MQFLDFSIMENMFANFFARGSAAAGVLSSSGAAVATASSALAAS